MAEDKITLSQDADSMNTFVDLCYCIKNSVAMRTALEDSRAIIDKIKSANFEGTALDDCDDYDTDITDNYHIANKVVRKAAVQVIEAWLIKEEVKRDAKKKKRLVQQEEDSAAETTKKIKL